MKRICIILPPFFSYPNNSGTAIETLVNCIGEENEKYKKLDLTILSKKQITLCLIDKFMFIIYRILHKFLKIDFFFLNRYYYKIVKKLKKNNYDYVIFEAGNLKEYERISKKIGKEKMIYHLHHSIKYENEECKKIIIQNFTYFIGVSNFVNEKLSNYSNINTNNIKLLYNCTSEKSFGMKLQELQKREIYHSLNLKENDFIVLFVGRLIKEKGIYELIKAIENIDNENIKLLIIGSPFSAESKDTEFSIELKELIKQFEKNIIFTGHVPHDQIYKYYQIADIQVIPTICEEAAGLVAIEGMINGLPIIATYSGGLVEYVNDECAIIVGKNENIVKNLECAILKLYNDRELCEKMSIQSKKRSQMFSMNKYYEKFVEIIEELDEIG